MIHLEYCGTFRPVDRGLRAVEFGGDFPFGDIGERVKELHHLELKGGEPPDVGLRDIGAADAQEFGKGDEIAFVEL